MLVVRSGSDSFYLDRRPGSFPIQVLTVDVGRRRSGGGLALQSFMLRQDSTLDAWRQRRIRIPFEIFEHHGEKADRAHG